ncbi:MAG: class 1 fructose-bisphosphatase [Candidatus Levybacteria bacterium]|nr:class 1 fructose-bisphosphatase [Candidatus Levybacteria bacterium]
MYTKPTSLTEFILEEERQFTDATGGFTLLLTQLAYATKIISSHISKAGLVDILGSSGTKNVFSDDVQKIDIFSNSVLVDILSATDQVATIASEELEEPIQVNDNGKYIVYMDPLDGSSNTAVNVSVGTIFSIYRAEKGLLQKGGQQIAAGYVIYGSSDMFVYTCGQGVNGFTLDPSIGSFLLSHPHITIPEAGATYSVNEAYSPLWDVSLQNYIASLKTTQNALGKAYKARYVGSMVSDIHRTLLTGGIFLYPKDQNNIDGKLRLLYEVNPMSFIIEQAGGRTLSNGKSPLTITPSSIHQKVPIVLGSPACVAEYEEKVR